MTEYSVQIDLIILDSEIDPKLISANLKIDADTALKRGERNPELNLPRRNIWSKRSQAASRDSFLEEHWANLSKQFSGKEAIVRQATGSGSVRLTIIVDGSGRFPPVTLPADMIRFASAIGADVDIDIYQ